MTIKDSMKIRPGVYRIYWKEGGYSVGAIGQKMNGRCWFTPANWLGGEPCQEWRRVERVELIELPEYAKGKA